MDTKPKPKYEDYAEQATWKPLGDLERVSRFSLGRPVAHKQVLHSRNSARLARRSSHFASEANDQSICLSIGFHFAPSAPVASVQSLVSELESRFFHSTRSERSTAATSSHVNKSSFSIEGGWKDAALDPLAARNIWPTYCLAESYHLGAILDATTDKFVLIIITFFNCCVRRGGARTQPVESDNK